MGGNKKSLNVIHEFIGLSGTDLKKKFQPLKIFHVALIGRKRIESTCVETEKTRRWLVSDIFPEGFRKAAEEPGEEKNV